MGCVVNVLICSGNSGVAVGSSIGHAIGGFFGGGSSAQPPAETQQADTSVTNAYGDAGFQANTNNNWGARNCEVDAKSFATCMTENGGNLQICGWYLEQLKACQAAANQ